MNIKKLHLKISLVESFSTLVLIVTVILALNYKIPFEDLTANPYSKFKIPFYAGLFQRVGIIIWCAIVFITLFTFTLLNNYDKSNKGMGRFLVSSGFLFGYFMIDEIFLLHGLIIPKFIGIHQLTVLIIYAAVIMIFIMYFRKEILKTEFIYFLVSLIFLGLSVTIDILSYLKVIQLDFRYIIDDGFKILGLVNLLIYYFFTCYNSILKELNKRTVRQELNLLN